MIKDFNIQSFLAGEYSLEFATLEELGVMMNTSRRTLYARICTNGDIDKFDRVVYGGQTPAKYRLTKELALASVKNSLRREMTKVDRTKAITSGYPERYASYLDIATATGFDRYTVRRRLVDYEKYLERDEKKRVRMTSDCMKLVYGITKGFVKREKPKRDSTEAACNRKFKKYFAKTPLGKIHANIDGHIGEPVFFTYSNGTIESGVLTEIGMFTYHVQVGDIDHLGILVKENPVLSSTTRKEA